jgi:chemotaxis protein MotB
MAEPAKEPKKGSAPAPVAPIIIKKIQGGHGGAHGGAWKIALADMMTAMMAFFLLMWLLGATSEAQRKSIADYFKPTPRSKIEMGQLAGSNGILGGRSVLDPEGMPSSAFQNSLLDMAVPQDTSGGKDMDKGPETDEAPKSEGQDDGGKGRTDGDKSAGSADGEKAGGAADGQQSGSQGDISDEQKRKSAEDLDKKNFEAIEKELKRRLAEDKTLSGLAQQVRFVQEKEGLRIEIIDKADFSMFSLGTTKLLPRAQGLIEAVAKSVNAMPNKVFVRGHTDSLGFSPGDTRNNWSLSAERAESTRQLLERQGVSPDRFSRIEGVADTDPFNKDDPYDPRNRRISITLQYQNGAKQ